MNRVQKFIQSPLGFNSNSRGWSAAEPVVCGHRNVQSKDPKGHYTIAGGETTGKLTRLNPQAPKGRYHAVFSFAPLGLKEWAGVFGSGGYAPGYCIKALRAKHAHPFRIWDMR